MKINNLFLVILFLVTLSCSKVPKEVKNTTLYTELIQHYETVDPHLEKKKAALFLFQYMDVKYSLYNLDEDKILTHLADSICKLEKRPGRREIVSALQRNALGSHKTEILYDYLQLESDELIRHIDITYKNWQALSTISGATFDEYCEFILPYRINEEPCNSVATELYFNQFKDIVDTLRASDSIIPVISKFIKSFDFYIDLQSAKYYPNTIAAQHILDIRTATKCDDLVVFLCLVLRSMGIPATYDFVPQWGNHAFLGHSWLTIKWQNKWYAFDGPNGNYLNDVYQKESIPKVYRKRYSISDGGNVKDVTNEYRNVVKITKGLYSFENGNSSYPAIAIFNKKTDFNVLDIGRKQGDSIFFENLGSNVVYFVGSVADNGFTPSSTPISVDSCGVISELIPQFEDLNTYVFHRKYPITYCNRNREKLKWAKSPSGSWIEASSDNFITIDTLLMLSEFNSFKEEYYNLKTEKKYNEVRYRCSPSNQLASLKFFNNRNELLTGKVVHNLWAGFKPEKIFDDNMLTWAYAGTTKRSVYIGYRFKKPQLISSVAIHARNDGNHIVTGDQYELFVFNNGWQSLGKKIADKQEIEFSEVPSGGLYWLKNLTRGVEELPFIMTANGEQYWVGQ